MQPAGNLVSEIGLGYVPHNRRDGHGNKFMFQGWASVRTAPGKNPHKSHEDMRERTSSSTTCSSGGSDGASHRIHVPLSLLSASVRECWQVRVPTPYEAPSAYGILSQLVDDILGALGEELAISNPPLMGTLPVGLASACLLRVPNSSQHLVAVDRSVMTFANLLSKACAQALMPSTNKRTNWPPLWKKWLAGGTHPGLHRYVELITAAVRDDPGHAPAYWPDAAYRDYATELRVAMELFVLAGPFLELALLDEEPDEFAVLPLPELHPQAESYVLDQTWRMRVFLLRLTVTISIFKKRGYNRSLAYWGIEMLLNSLSFIEVLQAHLAGRECPSDTRAQNEVGLVRAFLAEAEGKDSPSIRMLEWLDPIAEGLMAQAELAICGQEGDVH